MSTYNGWTNFETWRVNLEFGISDMVPEDVGVWNVTEDTRDDDINAVANGLEEMVFELVESESKGFALDLAKDFLSRVDWTEIAEHMVDDFITENK